MIELQLEYEGRFASLKSYGFPEEDEWLRKLATKLQEVPEITVRLYEETRKRVEL